MFLKTVEIHVHG